MNDRPSTSLDTPPDAAWDSIKPYPDFESLHGKPLTSRCWSTTLSGEVHGPQGGGVGPSWIRLTSINGSEQVVVSSGPWRTTVPLRYFLIPFM